MRGSEWLKRDKRSNRDWRLSDKDPSQRRSPSPARLAAGDDKAHLLDGGQDPRFPLVCPVRSDTQVDLVRVLVGDVTSGELEDAAMTSDTARKIGGCYVVRS